METICRSLANSTSFHRKIYSEVEEVGWEHLARVGNDLSFLSFRVADKKGRVHILEIILDRTYSKCPPSIAAKVPYMFDLQWSRGSKLKDVVEQFQQHLNKLQDFWSTLDDIDSTVSVVFPSHQHSALPDRKINIGNDCSIMLSLNTEDPRALPECRFLGSDVHVDVLRKKWRLNSKRWTKEKTFSDNLAGILGIQLPKPLGVCQNDQQTECGVCYAGYLPIDGELGAMSGSGTDYTCENSNCGRAFHSICLGDWLRSITTTRQSFDVLFGSCPYCSNPVAVKMTIMK